jgi:hypothetical protein
MKKYDDSTEMKTNPKQTQFVQEIFIKTLAEIYHLFYSVAFLALSGRVIILYREAGRMNLKRHELVLGGIILAAGVIVIIILVLTA